MLRPSGSQASGVTSKPNSPNTRGATADIAPLAQSTAIRIGPSGDGSGSTART